MVANKEEKTNHTHKLATVIEEEGCCSLPGDGVRLTCENDQN
jgi:hypothetical protein